MRDHIPVLLKETISLLDPKPGENFIDCTFGRGGHASAILEKTAPDGRVLGIEWDRQSLEDYLKKNNGENSGRLALANGNFADLIRIASKNSFYPVNGILLDLGMSSWHIDASSKGFSFLRDEPLDMRYSSESGISAYDIVNSYSLANLEKIISDYGQEKFAEQIAIKIEAARKILPIKTTKQLSEIIRKAMPSWYLRQRLHWAAKTFQALRIEANKELENIKAVLPQALEALAAGGRLAVISFHSLEDSIVKEFFKLAQANGVASIITKKTIRPSTEEIASNPRSRSAKLRVLIKN